MAKEKPDRPTQLKELFPVILDRIERGLYRQSKHAIDRAIERDIDLPDILYVLKNGYHEKQKTTFDEIFKVWKYSVRGKTVENSDIRIIIAFDDDGMLIITVIRMSKG